MLRMKILTKLILIIAIIGIVIFSGCAGTETDQESETGDDQGTPTADSNIPAGGTVQAADFKKLIEFLPEAQSGWTAEEPTGGSFTIEDGSWSTATRTYNKGDDESATITITDSAYYNVGLFQAWKGFVQMETSDGYFKKTTVKGYPAFETYSKSSKEYGSYVNVKDRIMVYIIVDNDDKNSLNAIQNSIDFSGLEGLI